MKFYEKEFLIYRITSGYLKHKISPDQSIYIYTPNENIRYLAQECYLEAYELAKDCDVYTEEEMCKFMCDLGLWSADKQELLDEILPKKIDDLKVAIYQANLNTIEREQLRSELRRLEAHMYSLVNELHQFDYTTCGGIATYYKLNFIIQNCTKNPDGTLYDWTETDIHTVTGFVNENHISEKDFRELAKSEPWTSIYSTSKKNGSIFNCAGVNLSDEQRRLIGFSTFYEQIHEHHECPHESIIEDDDMLDGWVILQRRERQKSQNEKAIEARVTNPKIANSQEIYIPVDTVEDAKKVEKMNSNSSSRVKKQRLVQATGKEVSDIEFADVRQDIAMKHTQSYVDTVKGKGK